MFAWFEASVAGRVESRDSGTGRLRLIFTLKNYLFLLLFVLPFIFALLWGWVSLRYLVNMSFALNPEEHRSFVALLVELTVFALVLLAPRVFGMMKWEKAELPSQFFGLVRNNLQEPLLAAVWFMQVLLYGYVTMNIYHWVYGVEVMSGVPKYMLIGN